MIRYVGAIIAGIVAWVVIVSILDRALQFTWPEYAGAVPIMEFTLRMMFARLTEAAVTTLAAGMVNRLVARTSRWPAAFQGVAILLCFLPIHYQLWQKFPVWYHLTFLGSLVPLTVLGAALLPKPIMRAPI